MIGSKVHFYVSDYITKEAEVQFIFIIYRPSFLQFSCRRYTVSPPA